MAFRDAPTEGRRLTGRRWLRRAVALLGLAGAATAATAQPLPPPAEAHARLLAAADARAADRAFLLRLAGHPDAGVRAEVARVVSCLGNPRGAGVLERLVGDAQGEVRAAVAEAAGRLIPDLVKGDNDRQRLEQVLLRLLGDRDPRVRAAAAWGVGHAGLEHAGRYLVQRLQHESDAGVKSAALRELWRAGGADWLGIAAAALSEADPGVRFAAAWSLARSPSPDADGPLRLAARDPQATVRVVALSAAQRGHGEALWSELCAATEDNDPRVRVAAFSGLAAALDGGAKRSLGEEVSARTIAMIGNDDAERVHERWAAIRLAGVGRVGADEVRTVATSDEPWLAGEAVVALARSGADDAPALASAALGSSEPERRIAGVQATRFLPNGQTALIALLGDALPAVRLAAVDELAAMKSQDAVTALRRLFSDDDPAVRAAAVEACAKLGALPRTETLLEALAKEKGQAMPDAAAALISALAQRDTLDQPTREALKDLVRSSDRVVARAAWGALRGHGVHEPLPMVATGKPPSFYREVLEWAGHQRWLEVVTIRGTIQVRLDTQRAPLAAFRISELAEKKFFDNLTIHRVVPDFVVQGGDPRGDGWGGPGFTLRDELSLVPFDAGAIGLALSGPDTGGSQLFVTITPQPHLLGRYPRLGDTVAGLEVASRLRRGDRIVRVRAGEGALPTFYPVWYGPLTPAALDAGISGWREERERYKPNQELLTILATAKLHYRLTVAMGTWCGDTRDQVPRLLTVLAALGAGSPFEAPRLVGTDRTKLAPASQFPFGDVELSPTIVVSIAGHEVGRIVETPTSGSIEGDLVRILAPIEGWPLEDPQHP
jgi:cyclophilin family peptidyl-prolyl cis-trans isomerase/HEAT repeat protein